MKCPKCSSDSLSVVDSRSDGNTIRRRRQCQDCAYRFSTYERVEYSLPMIVKKDGRIEPFSSKKLRSGLIKACEKRPVSLEEIDKVVDEIERKLQELCEKEVASTKLGEFVMEALKTLDEVAYVRFASVYWAFSDVSQFIETLRSLKRSPASSPNVAISVTDAPVKIENKTLN